MTLGASGPLLTWLLYGKFGAILLIVPLSLLGLTSAWGFCRLFHMQKKAILFSILFAEVVGLCLLTLLYPSADPETQMWIPVAVLFFVPYSLVTLVTVSTGVFLWRKDRFEEKAMGSTS